MAFRPSRITLGTAQFGQTYGVANSSGAPGFGEVCRMLEEAAAAGVNCLDTARAYGDSEQIVGRALSETGLHDHFTVVTKINNLIPPDLPPAEAKSAISESLDVSRGHLRRDCLPLVLLHRDTSPHYLDVLAEFREVGRLAACGVSFSIPGNVPELISHPALAAIQIPVNAIDARFIPAAQNVSGRDGLVFARSCYLQGLLLMEDESTQPHLLAIKPARDFLRQLARENAIPLPELLLRAMLSRPDITSVVVGMENQAQLRENLRIFQAPPLPPSLLSELENYPTDGPAWLADPAQWPAHAVPRVPAS